MYNVLKYQKTIYPTWEVVS